jgi:intein/homing endonuclease
MQIPKDISAGLAEETSWHIGDGSMNFYNLGEKQKGFYQLRGHTENDKEHYEKRIKPLFEKTYNHKIKIRNMPSTRVIGFQIWNDELINFKKDLGLHLGEKFEIEIPRIFLSKKELKKSVLRGIFDIDGGIYLKRKKWEIIP